MKHSESIANLAKSLAAFQKEVKNPKNTAKNIQFNNSKYAPLEEIMSTVRPLLGKNGLSILQEACGELESIKVTTLLLHESGEWMETEPFTLKGEQTIKGGGKVINIQGAGSMITYAKRYQVSAILGISSEDDDDGNAANKLTHKTDDNPIDEIKVATLKSMMESAKVKESYILETYDIEKLEDMVTSEFMDCMNKLEGTIKKREASKPKQDPVTTELTNEEIGL